MPTKEGSLVFRVVPDHADWATGPDARRFPPVQRGGVTAVVGKSATGIIEVKVSGLRDEPLLFEGNAVDYAGPLIHVVITWSPREVNLYLQGQPVGSVLG